MHPMSDIKKYILAGLSALSSPEFACTVLVATVLTTYMDWVLITPIKKYLQTLSRCIVQSQFWKYKDAAVGERLRLMAAYWNDT